MTTTDDHAHASTMMVLKLLYMITVAFVHFLSFLFYFYCKTVSVGEYFVLAEKSGWEVNHDASVKCYFSAETYNKPL